MSRFFAKLKTPFVASPLASLSFLISFWLFIRILIQWLHPYVDRHFPLDFPLFEGSPVVGVFEMTVTAIVLGGLGILLGLAAVFRRRERWRWWALLAVALNVGAFIVTALVNSWLLGPIPPGSVF